MDINMLRKLMEKKGATPMSPEYKKSKMDTLKDLHGEMGKMMGGDLAGLKKVTVAAPDSQGLQMGMDKAQELLGHGDDDQIGADDADADQDSDEDMQEEMAMSPEELDAKIQELQKIKEMKLREGK